MLGAEMEAEELKEAIEATGITRDELAYLLDVSEKTVDTKMKNGNWNLREAVILNRCLNIPWDLFVDYGYALGVGRISWWREQWEEFNGNKD